MEYIPFCEVTATLTGEKLTPSGDENTTTDRSGRTLPPGDATRVPEIVTVPPWVTIWGAAKIERTEPWGPEGEVTVTFTGGLVAAAYVLVPENSTRK
ncbi:MAG: hypothetical protein A4E40_00184 [Methanoregulaceae archaeon PtaU1.Bin059]|nr:MAG: hypothetical protein A4E40_00184 [Methanoregulaceae archaeon PtaU1.Bin059]